MPIEKLDEFAKNGQKSTEGIILENGFPQEEKPARQWFNYILNSLSVKVNEIIDYTKDYFDVVANARYQNLLAVKINDELFITNVNGEPVSGGTAYFGVSGQNPQFFPIDLFLDEGLTIPATQPIAIENGMISLDGNIIDLYADEVNYSVKVFDSEGLEVYSNLSQTRSLNDKMIITESGETQRVVNDSKYNKISQFGSSSNDVLYRLGTIYESKGAVTKQESRPFLHDFRPTIADGSEFNTDGVNLFIGAGAGNFTMKAVPDAELPVGFDSNLQCAHNVGYGVQALTSVTIGYKNLALGNNALRFLTEGHGNTAVGQEAARGAVNPLDGVYMGFSAGYYASGAYSVALGASALYNNASGIGNVAVGRRAGFDATSGDYNIDIGNEAGKSRTGGSYNIQIGKQVTGTGVVTASSCTLIGSRITGLEDAAGQVVLADGSGVTCFKHNPAGTTSAGFNLAGREVTAVDFNADDAQMGAGVTGTLRNLGNSGNAFVQFVLQSRVNQMFTRVIAWGGATQKISVVHNKVEALRVNADATVALRAAENTTSTALPSNGMISFELGASNTSLLVKVRCADGVTRTATLALT